VVVPVYNEALGIESACRAIAGALKSYPGSTRIIAVDDGSHDDSARILDVLAKQLPSLDVVRHERNAGYGAALRTGARRARQLDLQYVAFIDSDLTNPPADLIKIGELARRGHRYIKASRFIPGGDMSEVPLARRVASRSANLIASWLFATPVRDVTNGFRAGQTELICSWPTQETSFAVIVEEFAFALRGGVEPIEFPTALSARSSGQRRSAFSYSPRLILSYLRHPLRAFLSRWRRTLRR
jgi:dolichol-phosphate mannosyltransferase